MGARVRVDALLVERGLAPSGERARALILAGKVLVGGRPAAKPGTPVLPDVELTVLEPDIPFVGRGGVKLAGALDAFGLDVNGLTFLDIGASTGGFTDCLLQRGATRVYAVDVGYGQLDWRLRNDPRVSNHERVNARYLDQLPLPEKSDGAVIDVSFISLRLILPSLKTQLKPTARVVALVKPQFEAGPREVGRTGVIRDEAVRERVIGEVSAAAEALGYEILGSVPSSLPGAKGNLEHFLLLGLRGESSTDEGAG